MSEIRAKAALYYFLANRASDDGNKFLARKMQRRADKLVDRMYT